MLNTPEEVEQFYQSQLRDHGPTPRGMAWSDVETHWKRLTRIKRLLIALEIPFYRILDVGCGIGMLYKVWDLHHRGGTYYGVDVVQGYIDEAVRATHPDPNAIVVRDDFMEWNTAYRFTITIAVGTFAWQSHENVNRMLEKMWNMTSPGGAMAFTFIPGNPLTPQEVRLIGVGLGAEETLMYNGYSNVLNEHIAIFTRSDWGTSGDDKLEEVTVYPHEEEIEQEVLRGEHREDEYARDNS